MLCRPHLNCFNYLAVIVVAASLLCCSGIVTTFSCFEAVCKARGANDRRPPPLSFPSRLSAVRPLDALPHSPTLGAEKILVINLEKRQDRRQAMDKLQAALQLDWEYVPATPKEDGIISRIQERVLDVRKRIGDETVFSWPPDTDGFSASLNGSDFWTLPIDDPRSSYFESPPPNAVNWMNVPAATKDMTIPKKPRPLTDGRLACWHSHVSAIRRLAEELPVGGFGLILEDDVDFEWDIERKMRGYIAALPEDWDMLLLGHCFSPSREVANRPLRGSPNVHPSHSPLCSHAYALSQVGARKLWAHLRYPLFAYSRAVDAAIKHLIVSERLNSFSVSPSVIVQRKDGYTDIGKIDEAKGWKDWLTDSTMERIHLLEALDA